MGDELDLPRLTHRVVNLVRNTQADRSTHEQTTQLLRRVCELLEPTAWTGPYAVEQLCPPGDGRLVYEPDDLTRTVPFSPLLGGRNPLAPEVLALARGGAVEGSIRFSPVHAGPMGHVHGGMLSALFDEILALSTIVAGHMAFTRSITVRYRKPTPLDSELQFRAVCIGLDEGNRNLVARAELRYGEEITVEAEGLFKPVFRREEDPYAAHR